MGRKIVSARRKIGSDNMNSNVLDMRCYVSPTRTPNVTMLDMIFNPSKRVEMYKELDRNYTSTKEEEDIFSEINQRRKRDF